MSPNEKKLKNLILYILNNYNNPDLTITKLQKLLYFCDFDHFQKYSKPITNFTYFKNHYGPTIKTLTEVLLELETDGAIKILRTTNYFGAPQTNFAPLKQLENEDSEFDTSEKLIIDEVNNSYAGLTSREISALSHIDPPYVLAKDQEEIQYDNVLYREEDSEEEETLDPEAQDYFDNTKLDDLFTEK